MSDKLADVLIAAAGGITQAFAAGAGKTPAAPKPSANKTPDKPATTAASGAKAANGAAGAATTKPATAAAKPADVQKAAKPKAPAGQYNAEQVKNKMREVLQAPGLGRERVIEILDEEAGGAKQFGDVKPEDYDKLYEAFDGALNSGEGDVGNTGAATDDLGV